MSLDRHSSQRPDFPTRLRGYDRAAVDAHLRALADELEGRAGSVASATGEQVRAVLAAAEASAAEIRREAEREARHLREQAAAALRSADALASSEQRDRAERVVATSGAALDRLDALRSELTALLDALGRPGPTAAEQPPAIATEDPDRLVPDPDAPAKPADPDRPVPDPEAPDAPASPDDPDHLVPDPDAPATPQDPDHPVPDPDAPPPMAGDDAEAGARLVALDLALSGAPREQADRYLAEHFPVGDRAALLEEVYAAATR